MLRCEECKRSFERPNKRGPIPRFCSAACRQAHFRRRWHLSTRLCPTCHGTGRVEDTAGLERTL